MVVDGWWWFLSAVVDCGCWLLVVGYCLLMLGVVGSVWLMVVGRVDMNVDERQTDVANLFQAMIVFKKTDSLMSLLSLVKHFASCQFDHRVWLKIGPVPSGGWSGAAAAVGARDEPYPKRSKTEKNAAT